MAASQAPDPNQRPAADAASGRAEGLAASPERVVKAPRVRLDYLDTIRFFAALVVVFHHAYGFAIGNNIGQFPRVFAPIYHSMLYAHYAVDVFIVLSGYVLMIPVVRAPGLTLSGGFGGYIRRRGRRILPPYYAALFLALFLLPVTGSESDSWTSGGLFTHLILVHNLDSAWDSQINPALWSVATEWHIYFLFPLLLLPMVRRWGAVAAMLVALALTVTPYALWPGFKLAETACPWYLGLFAAGNAAAVLNFSTQPLFQRLRERIPWRLVLPLLALSAPIIFALVSGGRRHWLNDPLVGILVAGFLAYCTNHRQQSRGGPLVAFLDARTLVKFGGFSYSLYLVHLPILALLRRFVPHDAFSPTLQFCLVIPVEIVCAVVVSYVFSLAFERPFMSERAPAPRPAAEVASG